MICKTLFFETNKKNISNCRLPKILPSMISVNRRKTRKVLIEGMQNRSVHLRCLIKSYIVCLGEGENMQGYKERTTIAVATTTN